MRSNRKDSSEQCVHNLPALTQKGVTNEMDIHNGNGADSTVRHGDVYGLRTYEEE